MNPYSFSYFDCVLGTIYIINTPKGISAIIFGKNRFKEFIQSLNEVKPIQGGEAEKSIREIRLYIGGRLKEFQVKLDLSSGTPFQISVWRELLKIPYGQVRTYGEIARRIGNPNAARAVGGAVGANPIPIIVPCHRVVATNGLGGYSSGIEIKKKLLHIERVLS
ncbi:MAG TPA: methylated-DNA--[protein]-cysteine S-methyltransferase [Thermodesulfobacteriota bacterium]